MKQIKTFTLALAAALLLLAAGCTDERDGSNTGNIAPGTPVEINFDAPTVASNGTATRAAAMLRLPANATVRITPYNKSKNRYESSVTYYVGTPADGKGKLIPYTSQNADGTFVAGTKMKVIMSDTYLFYVSTPAKAITSDGYKQTVGNNEDYASAVSGDCIVTSGFVTNAFCFPPPTLVRRCAQITIKVMPSKPGSMKIASAPGGAKLSGLRSAQAGIDPGVAIPTTGGTNDQSYTVTTLQHESLSLLGYNSFCVLPGLSSANLAVQLITSLQPDGTTVVDKTVTYATKINFTEPLKPGYKYEIGLTVNIENAEVLPTVTITDWDMTGGNVHPGVGTDENPNYPYVTANAKGKMSVLVFQDVFGGVMDLPSSSASGFFLHEPWLQTPTHIFTALPISGVGASFSPRFEVAESNSPIGATAWGSTNEGCPLPWRRPTSIEAKMIKVEEGKLSGVDSFLDIDFWTATEFDNNRAWTAGDILNKTDICYTRCVRDFGIVSPDYAHVKDGKFVISEDEYGTTGGAFHPKWGSNDVPLHYRDDVQYNTVSARFEVSEILSDGESGNTAKELCAAHSQPSGAAGTWRVPTMAEYFLMYDLRAQLPAGFFTDREFISSTHNVPGNDYSYWGFNPTWKDGYMAIHGGAVCCVRDY